MARALYWWDLRDWILLAVRSTQHASASLDDVNGRDPHYLHARAAIRAPIPVPQLSGRSTRHMVRFHRAYSLNAKRQPAWYANVDRTSDLGSPAWPQRDEYEC